MKNERSIPIPTYSPSLAVPIAVGSYIGIGNFLAMAHSP